MKSFFTKTFGRDDGAAVDGFSRICRPCAPYPVKQMCESIHATFAQRGFATFDSHLTDGGKNEITLKVPLYQEKSIVQLEMQLYVTASQGEVDLPHTARLFIDVPGGFFT